MNNEAKGMLLGFVGICAFGLTLPMTKIAIPYLNPIFIGLGRASFAAIFAAVFLIAFKESIPHRKHISQLLIVAAGVVVGFPLFSSIAMQYVPASHGGVIAGILPLATAIVGSIIGHERPSLGFWIVSLLGAFFVVCFAFIQGAGSLHIGDLALLGAVASAAIGYAVGAKLSIELGGWQVISWSLILAFPLLIFPTLYYAPATLNDIPTEVFISFLYLALVSQLLGFFAWYKGLAIGGIARVSQIQLIMPFITIVAAYFLVDEAIDFISILFASLVVGSVWLGKKMPIDKKV